MISSVCLRVMTQPLCHRPRNNFAGDSISQGRTKFANRTTAWKSMTHVTSGLQELSRDCQQMGIQTSSTLSTARGIRCAFKWVSAWEPLLWCWEPLLWWQTFSGRSICNALIAIICRMGFPDSQPLACSADHWRLHRTMLGHASLRSC